MKWLRSQLTFGNVLTLIGIAIFVYEQWKTIQKLKRSRQRRAGHFTAEDQEDLQTFIEQEYERRQSHSGH